MMVPELSLNDQAHRIANQLTADLVDGELDIAVSVNLGLVINLGYDQGEYVSASRFLLAVRRNVERLLTEVRIADAIDSVERLT
jgi:hypothetical protein